MRFAIHYLTGYRYDEPVSDNLNVLRVTPASTPTQELEDFRVQVDPEARLHRHTDYFGAQVVEFGITRPHEHLTIDVRARVSTSEPPAPLGGGWEGLGEPAYATAGAEYLLPSPIDGRWDDTLGELRAAVRGETPADTVRALCELIPDRFEYRAGVTYVGSTVEDLLEGGAGVCQDFAHLAVAALRVAGLPARYVSGYLETQPPPGRPRLQGADASHAWAAVLLPEVGWVDLDPTNDQFVDDRYVVTAWGRDYGDVPPVKGVIFTEASTSTLRVAVDVTRL